jgi:hypothetical protein
MPRFLGNARIVGLMSTNRITPFNPIGTVFLLSAVVLLPLACSYAQAGDPTPKQWVNEVIARELKAANEDSSHWMYRQHHEEPGKNEVRECVETSAGLLCRKLQQDGHDLSPEQQARELKRIQEQLNNRGERRRQEKARKEDAEKALAMLKILPTAFVYSLAGTEGDVMHLRFEPNPNFDPPSREAHVLHCMSGILSINTRAKRLVELQGHLTRTVEFGGGFLGYLEKGGTFEVKRTDVGGDHWETTLLNVNIHGKALFFKSINAQQHEVTGYYHRVPDNLTLARGIELLRSPLARPVGSTEDQALARSR